MRTALILLLLALATPALADQTVWKWVDERGVTHYSDRPVPGAVRVELSTPQGRSSSSQSDSAPATSQAPQSQPSAARPAAAPAQAVYRNLEIWKPLRDETIANTGGVVQVNVRVDPALSAQHRLNLYLDGRRIDGFPPGTTDFELKDVARGLHSVIAVIADPTGNRVQETAPVVFTVRQESVAKPPVGPSLKPPPKPRQGNAANKLPSSQPSYGALNGGRKPIDPYTNMPVVTKPAPKGPHAGS